MFLPYGVPQLWTTPLHPHPLKQLDLKIHNFRFDTKNCTLHEGLMAPNGTCYQQVDLSPAEWDSLNKTVSEMKLPADEFFQ